MRDGTCDCALGILSHPSRQKAGGSFTFGAGIHEIVRFSSNPY